MKDKPFKTYEELVVKLRDEKKLVIAEEDEAKVIALLKKYSYFSMISGYKALFKQADGTYMPDTRIDDILALYKFDDTLRDEFFHAIQIVEKNIKSLLSYSFVALCGDDQAAYLSPASYDEKPGTKNEGKRKAEIRKLVSTLFSIVIPPSDHKSMGQARECPVMGCCESTYTRQCLKNVQFVQIICTEQCSERVSGGKYRRPDWYAGHADPCSECLRA